MRTWQGRGRQGGEVCEEKRGSDERRHNEDRRTLRKKDYERVDSSHESVYCCRRVPGLSSSLRSSFLSLSFCSASHCLTSAAVCEMLLFAP